MLGAKGAKIVPTVKHTIITINIFLAPTRSDSLPIITVITAPQIMYAVITQDAVEVEILKSSAIPGRAGDIAVLR
jgi:hypothetical protein